MRSLRDLGQVPVSLGFDSFKLVSHPLGLILYPVARGMFKVNPKYFFTGENEKRIRDIKVELEMRNEGTNFKIIKVTER